MVPASGGRDGSFVCPKKKVDVDGDSDSDGAGRKQNGMDIKDSRKSHKNSSKTSNRGDHHALEGASAWEGRLLRKSSTFSDGRVPKTLCQWPTLKFALLMHQGWVQVQVRDQGQAGPRSPCT